MAEYTDFEKNVMQVALDHLKEMHSDLIGEDTDQDDFHNQVIDTCNLIQITLK